MPDFITDQDFIKGEKPVYYWYYRQVWNGIRKLWKFKANVAVKPYRSPDPYSFHIHTHTPTTYI